MKEYKVDFSRDNTSDYMFYHDFDGDEDLKWFGSQATVNKPWYDTPNFTWFI